MIGHVGAFVLTAGLVAEMGGGRLAAGPADRPCPAVVNDTRTLVAGQWFVALRGEHADGHDFVADAVARGAGGVIVARPPADPGDAAVVVVHDPLAALQAVGRAVRRRSGARVVAITGSAGKTTTKELTADLLAARFDVYRTRGNFNNHIGLPMSLVELQRGPDVAVLELGMNHAGEIRQLVGLAEPDVRVWTNVGDAHIEFFGSRDAIARAKAEILERAGAATVAVVNADDPLVVAHVAGFPGRVIRAGTGAGADVRATRIEDRGLDGSLAEVATPAGPLRIVVRLPGRGQLLNALVAIAVAVDAGVPLEAIAPRVAAMAPVARRGTSTILPGGARLVDDSYNASPEAVRMMVAALAATRCEGRRIAVLGEMLELGDAAVALHEACGRAVAQAGIDRLVAVGGAGARAIAAGARGAGLPDDRIDLFDDSTAAAGPVRALVAPGDLVLVKGSRGTRMERVADRLREGA
ncbi:MAG: UDP-N-acetylmuramoyl-tripeptide--D-alanyl-D-alanine ligase [Vicinamibacterales bacterium]